MKIHAKEHVQAHFNKGRTHRKFTTEERFMQKIRADEHPYDEINTRLYQGRRYCRACLKLRA